MNCIHTQILSEQNAGLEFTRGFHIHFDQISRILSFVASNPERRRFYRAELAEVMGLSEIQTGIQAKAAAAMGLLAHPHADVAQVAVPGEHGLAVPFPIVTDDHQVAVEVGEQAVDFPVVRSGNDDLAGCDGQYGSTGGVLELDAVVDLVAAPGGGAVRVEVADGVDPILADRPGKPRAVLCYDRACKPPPTFRGQDAPVTTTPEEGLAWSYTRT